jgi:hypothetical protein
MKHAAKAALAVSLAAALSGCSSDLVTGGPLLRPGEPTGFIEVVNHSNGPINVVLISTCSASTYGLNRLPSGSAIPRGGSYTFTVSAGCWDIDAGSTSRAAEARQRMQVRAGGGARYVVGG